MTMPNIVAWNGVVSGSLANGPNPSYPAGVQAGDLLIYFIAAGRIPGAFAVPDGWSEHPASPVDVPGGGAGIYVYYKIAAGDESGATGQIWKAISNDNAYVTRMVAIRGVDTTPFDGSSSNASTSTESPASLPAGTTENNHCLVLIALALSRATAPQPTAMTNEVLTDQTFVFSAVTTSSDDGTLNIQHGKMVTAGSWGDTTIPKNTNSVYAVVGISVRGISHPGGSRGVLIA